MSAAAIPQSDQLSRRAWGALLVLCGALFLDALDVSMIGVALPSIRTDLAHVDELAPVGRERVRARLRRLPAARRPRRRPARPAARVPDLARRLRRRVRVRRLRERAARSSSRPASSRASARRSRRPPASRSSRRRSPRARHATRRSRSTPRPGATGFSLGLVFGGLLTEIGWRWVFFLPAPVALVALARRASASFRTSSRPRFSRAFDVAGAVTHDRVDAAARLHARRGADRRLGLGPHARLARRRRSDPRRLRRARAQRRRAARPARHPALARRSSGPTSPRCRSSAAGSASSSSSRCTCSSCAAGRRSRPGSRSSPAAPSSRSSRRGSRR